MAAVDAPPGADAGGGGGAAAGASPRSEAAAEAEGLAAEVFQEPLHLLKPSEDHGSLIADPAALRRLEALGKVTVLSLVGNQRGGKSSLMNLLHSRRLSGFQTGHYLDPQTHGVWVWPKPHPRKPGVTVLLVDSEGLDSPNVPQHYGWLVAAVTVLMSDVFMYQTRASIEQSSAERLDMILKVVEQLGRSSGNKSKVGIFMWLLRDHQLQMKRSPKEELERLAPEQMAALRRNFAEYDCVPLPRPATDDVLAHLDRHSFHELKPEFQEEFIVFERRLWELLAEPRQLCGGDLTGLGLSELLGQYISAISHRQGMLAEICDMPTHRELLRQLAGRRAVEAGVQRYKDSLLRAGVIGSKARLPVQPALLLASHAVANQAALEALEAEAKLSGIEADELSGSRQKLEQQLACWSSQLRPAAPEASAVLATPCLESLGPGLCGATEEEAQRKASPVVTQVQSLQGGLLLELWHENAQRSLGTFKSWLSATAKLKDEVLSTCRAKLDGPSSAEPVLAVYHSALSNALQQMGDEDSGQYGPWPLLMQMGCADVSNKESGSTLFRLIQHGNEVVTAIAEAGIHQATKSLQEHMQLAEERSAETLSSLKDELSAANDCSKSSLLDVQTTLRRLEATFKDSDARHDAQAETFTELLNSAQEQHRASLAELRESLQSAAAESDARHDAQATSLKQLLDSAQEQHRASLAELHDSLKSSAAESDARHDAQATSLKQLLDSGQQQLEASVVDLRNALQSTVEESATRHESEAASLRKLVASAEEQQGSALSELRGALDKLQDALAQSDGQHSSNAASLRERLASVEEQHSSSLDKLQGALAESNQRHETETGSLRQLLASAEEQHGKALEALQALTSRMEQIEGVAIPAVHSQLKGIEDAAKSKFLDMEEKLTASGTASAGQREEFKGFAAQLGSDLQAAVQRLSTLEAAGEAQKTAVDATEERLAESMAKLDPRLAHLEQSLEAVDGRVSKVQAAGEERQVAVVAVEGRLADVSTQFESSVSQMKTDLQAAFSRLEESHAGEQQSAVAAVEGRLTEVTEKLQLSVADVERGLETVQGRLSELKGVAEEGVDALRRQSSDALNRLEDLVANKTEGLEGRLGEAREQVAAALAAAERTEASVDGRVRQLLDAALREALEAADRPLVAEIAALKKDTTVAAEELRSAAELIKKNDFDSIWESLGEMASRLAEVQCVIDGLGLKRR